MKAILGLLILVSWNAGAAELLRCTAKTGKMQGRLTLLSDGQPTLKITDDKGVSHKCALKTGFANHAPHGVAPGFLLSLILQRCEPALSAKATERIDSDLRLMGRWREKDALESRLQWLKTEEPSTCAGKPASRADLDAYLKTIAEKRG